MSGTFNGRDYRNDTQGGAPSEQQPRGPENPPAPEQRPAYPDRGGSDAPRGEYSERGSGGYDRGEGGGYQGGRGGYGGGGRGGGGYGRGGGGNSRDPNYAFISYLYPSGKNGGFSVFLKRDMLEILKSLDDDDIVGISPSGRDGWMMYAKRVPAADKENYRNRGGGGRGQGGGGYRR